MYKQLHEGHERQDILKVWDIAKTNGYKKINVRFRTGILKCKILKKTERCIIYLYSMPDFYYVKTTDIDTKETWDEVQFSRKVRFSVKPEVHIY